MSWCRAAASGARPMASRKTLSLNICASSDRICRCFSVAFSGTSSTKTRVTGLPSGASKGTGCARRMNAPSASFRPLMRPCGMATPWPRPVEPRRSRAKRLSNTRLRASACWFSNSRPTCSNRRFLLDTCRSMTTSAGASSLDTRVMMAGCATCKGGASYSLIVELVLVAQDLPVELVGEEVDGGIQFLLVAFVVQVLAAHVQGHFGLLAQLVHGEDDVRVDHVVEMAADALEL